MRQPVPVMSRFWIGIASSVSSHQVATCAEVRIRIHIDSDIVVGCEQLSCVHGNKMQQALRSSSQLLEWILGMWTWPWQTSPTRGVLCREPWSENFASVNCLPPKYVTNCQSPPLLNMKRSSKNACSTTNHNYSCIVLVFVVKQMQINHQSPCIQSIPATRMNSHQSSWMAINNHVKQSYNHLLIAIGNN